MAKKASALTLVTSLDPTDLIVASPADGTSASKAFAYSTLRDSFLSVTPPFNDDEIKAMPTNSPITLVEGVPGKIFFPVGGWALSKIVAPYTKINPHMNFQIQIGDGDYDGEFFPTGVTGAQYMLGGISRLDGDCGSWISGDLINLAGKPLVLVCPNEVVAGRAISGSLVGDGTGADDFSYFLSAPSGNTGVGSGATFAVTIAGGVMSLVTISEPGSGYQVGDVLSFTGDVFNAGATPANDFTITITAVNSVGGALEGGHIDNRLLIRVRYEEFTVPA